MKNEELIIDFLKKIQSDIGDLKIEIKGVETRLNQRIDQNFEIMNVRFKETNDKIDQNFEIMNFRFKETNDKINVLSEISKERFEVLHTSEKEIKEVQQREVKKLTEIYNLKEKIEFKWTKKFVAFNAGVSAVVSVFTTWLMK